MHCPTGDTVNTSSIGVVLNSEAFYISKVKQCNETIEARAKAACFAAGLL